MQRTLCLSVAAFAAAVAAAADDALRVQTRAVAGEKRPPSVAERDERDVVTVAVTVDVQLRAIGRGAVAGGGLERGVQGLHRLPGGALHEVVDGGGGHEQAGEREGEERERIKAGSGEKMRKPGTKGAPTAKAFKESAKTAKKGK